MSDQSFVYVLGASYDSVDAAEADYDAVRALYSELGASHTFDAAVISKNDDGKVKINKTFEEGTRFDAITGAAIGLAVGVVAALFPPIGIWAALAAGGVGGAAIGGVVGHLHSGLKRGDLKELGDVLDAGEAGLIVVYSADLGDQISTLVKAENRFVSEAIDADADKIAAAIKANAK